MKAIGLIVLVLGLLGPQSLWAAERALVQGELISENSVATPGRTLQLGIALDIAPGWHIYWLHPGDAGLPTRVDWTLPESVTLEEVHWPAPTRFLSFGVIESFGYHSKIVIPVTVFVEPDAVGPITLQARVSWLGCRDDCVPGVTDVALTLPTAGVSARQVDAARIEKGLARVPHALQRSDPFKLVIEGPSSSHPGESIRVGVRVKPRRGAGTLRLEGLYVHPNEGLQVSREERRSELAIRVPLSIPEESKLAIGSRLAQGVAEVHAQSEKGETTYYIAVDFPAYLK